MRKPIRHTLLAAAAAGTLLLSACSSGDSDENADTGKEQQAEQTESAPAEDDAADTSEPAADDEAGGESGDDAAGDDSAGEDGDGAEGGGEDAAGGGDASAIEGVWSTSLDPEVEGVMLFLGDGSAMYTDYTLDDDAGLCIGEYTADGNVTLECRPEGEPVERTATVARDGDDLVMTWDDGTDVTLLGLDGTEVTLPEPNE